MQKLNTVVFSALLLLGSYAQAYEFDWKVKRSPKKVGEVSTFVSAVEGHSVKAFKGIV